MPQANSQKTLPPAMSVLIPASNEAALIGVCLGTVCASTWSHSGWVEVIVIANGCKDTTAKDAAAFMPEFSKKGWDLQVLDRKEGGKLAALNAGDRIARGGIRVYLDADVEVSKDLLDQVFTQLDTANARYASGKLVIAEPQSFTTKAYRRIYEKVPFLQQGVPGAGLFAVNAAGRLRWGAFPDIISDDTFVRLSFRPNERVKTDAEYSWPLVEGWRNLVRVRRRQNIGVDQIRDLYPQLLQNDDKPSFPITEKLKLALKDPIGFAVYSGVAIAVRLTPRKSMSWSRGR